MSIVLADKICSAEHAVSLIKDNDPIASEGFTLFLQAEALSSALEKRFLATGEPKDLTLVFSAMHGLSNKEGGIGHFAHQGLLKTIIGGYLGWFPEIGKLVLDEKVMVYNLPQGVISQLYRDIAAKRPGCITHVGLETFIDPLSDGARVNSCTPPDFIERIQLGGKDWIWYKSFPIDIAFLSATAIDPYGNLVMDQEPFFGTSLSIAQAVHNSNGIVIAQVGKILDKPAHPHHIKVPGILVDKVVVGRPHENSPIYASNFKPEFCLPSPAITDQRKALEPLPMSPRRIITERACDEIPGNAIVNLGIGMPEDIAKIAAEKNLLNNFTLTVESGPIGGLPASGLSFGAAVYPQAVINANAQFDFYDGGGLDYAALGAAQIDSFGNVNVSKFNHKIAGVGGFVNISQTAKIVVFCATFTVGGLEIEVSDGNLHITQEGKFSKFVTAVEQISFSAKQALIKKQKVLYITERAVFQLGDTGLELIEIALGIDLERDILSLLDFRPVIRNLNKMSPHLFSKTAAKN
ncbi:MAG: acyl CoA:acetate/3-ketoacid CoA transferase [Spirochaetes bacterium]|nr:acyl CoA:acetate/3-ketoacid CoA transferase [Spirochaetota bacterium]